tara:strand:- start:140 stop:286 length:147 start_codon:yes stop_codon:yes gene_type:complete
MKEIVMAKDKKVNNLVAKHARKVCLAHVFRDRKKDSRRGYVKHKGKES